MAAVVLLTVLASAPVEVSHRRVGTEDGAALALYRYRAVGDARRGPPVLLVGDLGFGRALFDSGGHGLARFLAAGGRTVFVAELRGQGAADATGSLRTVVHLDLPAIARALQGPVDLVAHGWLGTLALAAAGRELPVRRVVALATPVDAEVPSRDAEALLVAGGRFSAWSGSPEGAAAFARSFVAGSAIDPSRRAALLGAGLRDLSASVAAELLAWMRQGDLPLDDGTTVTQRLRALARPTLLVLALGDGWAGAELCAPLRELAPGPVTVRTYSRVTDGDDFSHLTLLQGDLAPRRVFPELLRFLDAEAP